MPVDAGGWREGIVNNKFSYMYHCKRSYRGSILEFLPVNGYTNSKYDLLPIFLYFSLSSQHTNFCYCVVHFQQHITSKTSLVPYSLSTR